eukprot:1158545-Pelagomonas_calceolata.AAC.6
MTILAHLLGVCWIFEGDAWNPVPDQQLVRGQIWRLCGQKVEFHAAGFNLSIFEEGKLSSSGKLLPISFGQIYFQDGAVLSREGWRWRGLPSVSGGRRTPAEAKRCLQGASELLEGNDVVVVSDQEHEPCMLKCTGCGEVMSPNSPLQTCKHHSSSCECPDKAKVMIHIDDGEAGPSRFVGRQGQSSLTSYKKEECQV